MAHADTIHAAQNVQAQKTLDTQQKMRLQHAVKEFEAVLVGYMLKSMRSSIPKDSEGEGGYGADLMEGMFDAELARHVSQGSSFGLGEMLYKEITGEDMPNTRTRSTVRSAFPAAESTEARARGSIGRLSTGDAGRQELPPILTAAESAQRGTGETRSTVVAGAIGATPAAPPDTVRRRVEAFSPIIQSAAQRHGVEASLLKAVIATESAGQPTARSPKQAKGLMQLIDSTAAAMGVRNVWDPGQNVNGGAKYLSQLIDRFQGDLERAIASYNAGPGAVEKHNGIPPFKETTAYVGKVLQYLKYFQQQEPAINDED